MTSTWLVWLNTSLISFLSGFLGRGKIVAEMMFEPLVSLPDPSFRSLRTLWSVLYTMADTRLDVVSENTASGTDSDVP